MMRFFLMLVFVCLSAGFVQAQSNAVTLKIKLYPVQILEVYHEEVGDVLKWSTNENDGSDAELPNYVNMFSTSHFVLKVDSVPLFVPIDSDKPISETVLKPESLGEEVSHQVMYSMEAI